MKKLRISDSKYLLHASNSTTACTNQIINILNNEFENDYVVVMWPGTVRRHQFAVKRRLHSHKSSDWFLTLMEVFWLVDFRPNLVDFRPNPNCSRTIRVRVPEQLGLCNPNPYCSRRFFLVTLILLEGCSKLRFDDSNRCLEQCVRVGWLFRLE